MSLAEANRMTQIALEAPRVDPDDEQTYHDYLREKAMRDELWYQHAEAQTLATLDVL